MRISLNLKNSFMLGLKTFPVPGPGKSSHPTKNLTGLPIIHLSKFPFLKQNKKIIIDQRSVIPESGTRLISNMPALKGRLSVCCFSTESLIMISWVRHSIMMRTVMFSENIRLNGPALMVFLISFIILLSAFTKIQGKGNFYSHSPSLN